MRKFFVVCLAVLVCGVAKSEQITSSINESFVRSLAVALKEADAKILPLREMSATGGCGSMKNGVAVKFLHGGAPKIVFIDCYEYGVRINSGNRQYVDENADGKIELVAEGVPGKIPKAIYANELYFPQINVESGPAFQKEFEDILLSLWRMTVQEV